MNKVNIVIAASLLLTAVSCINSGKSSAPAAQAPSPEQVQLPTVEVVGVRMMDVPQENTYSSTVQANIVNNIAPQTAGRIVKVNCEIGDFVSEGQILAEMEKTSLEQAELRLKNAQDELDRVKQLFDEGAISRSDYEQIELNCRVAKSSYDNLLSNTILRSPVSGVVTARNYDRGDMYSMAQPLFTVQQITPVKLLVGISEADYTKVKKGDKASVSVDALPGKTFEGTIVRLYPTIDAATHTFKAEVQVRNENRALRPGMFGRVTVTFSVNRNPVVPDSAVTKQQGSGQRLVYVVGEDDTVTGHIVTLGRHVDGMFEILSGLQEGDRVVVKGHAALRNGTKVEIL